MGFEEGLQIHLTSYHIPFQGTHKTKLLLDSNVELDLFRKFFSVLRQNCRLERVKPSRKLGRSQGKLHGRNPLGGDLLKEFAVQIKAGAFRPGIFCVQDIQLKRSVLEYLASRGRTGDLKLGSERLPFITDLILAKQVGETRPEGHG